MSDGHARRSAKSRTAAIANRAAATVNGGTSATATLPATIAPPKKKAVAVSIARPVARRAASGESCGSAMTAMTRSIVR